MALMLGKFYEALRSVNVPSDKARAAAEELATYEQVRTDAYLLKWMMGFLIAMVLGVFWMQWQMVSRLGDVQAGLGGLQVGLTNVQSQLVDVKGQLSSADGRLRSVEGGVADLGSELAGVKDRLGRIETHLGSAEGSPRQR